MCVSKGAPKKPAYGPCDESHQQQPITYTYPTGGMSYWNTTSAGSTTAATDWLTDTGTTANIGWITI